MDSYDLLSKVLSALQTQWQGMLAGVITRTPTVFADEPELPIAPGTGWPIIYPVDADMHKNLPGDNTIDWGVYGFSRVDPANPWTVDFVYRDQTAQAQGRPLADVNNDMRRVKSAFYLFYDDPMNRVVPCTNGISLLQVGQQLDIKSDPQGNYQESANQVQKVFLGTLSLIPCTDCGG